jgi:ubiquinone/menaquinone biosynthesis C-methylase UbiE
MSSDLRATNDDIAYFNNWAATYDRSILQGIFFTRVHTHMLKLLDRKLGGTPPESLIDVGCGTGRLLAAAGRRWPDVTLLGADPAERMVSEMNRIRPDLAVRLATAESLPFEDESADIVTTSLSFHHWSDQARGIAEIARVLRPGGIFCIADHTFLPAKLFGERPMSARQLAGLMTASGLAVVRQHWAGLPFILVSLARK